jgi:hypothetical protein
MLSHRQQTAVAASHRLVDSAVALTGQSWKLRDDALRIKADAARARADRRKGSDAGRPEEAWFTVRGIVDGVPTVARWSPTYLDCDGELLRRATVIVALGESFTTPSAAGQVVHASLDAPPIAVLLTIMRAFSSVNAVDLSLDTLGARVRAATE